MWLRLASVAILLVLAIGARETQIDESLQMVMRGANSSPLVKKGLTDTLPLQMVDNYMPLKLPSSETIKLSLRQASKEFGEEVKKECGIDQQNASTSIFGPHLLTDTESLEINVPGTILAEATQAIVNGARTRKRENVLSAKEKFENFDLINRLKGLPTPTCPFTKPICCNGKTEYRTIDGSCNNIAKPYWGKSHTPFERFLIPDFQGTNMPRKFTTSANLLPLVRNISTTVHKASVYPDDLSPPISYYTMQFGQFLDHDITKTAISKGYPNNNIECCSTDFPNKECFPIQVPDDDPYFMGHTTCLNFVRSTATPDLDCDLTYRQQLNELTHFIDASNVYGSTQQQLNQLRDGTTAFMKTSSGKKLPLDTSNKSGCHITPSKPCFLAGDKRANVQPGLSAIHTVWLREHNRIADYLQSNNPHWCPEKVFQEARRYVAAEMQHIVYNEFLPKILHNIFMDLLDLKPKSAGHFLGYDPSVKPMIRNAFATAAFRFGHSLLRDKFFFNSNPHDMHTQFNKPDLLYEPQGIEGCTRGLYDIPTQGIDELMTPEITNKLFETLPFNGGDLAAFNIQRGRDHGLPSYSKWVEACYGPLFKVTSFQSGVIGGLIFHSAASAARLESVYENPEDMDLFPAAMSEKNLPESKLGPTFSCIIGLQFKALKYGDRLYYEADTTYPFTTSQLNSIRQTRMARVICDNTDITQIQRDVFLEEDNTSNPEINCTSSELPPLDLPCTVVNGGWTSWQQVSKCKQIRYCNNPPPTECGTNCVGNSVRFICIISGQKKRHKTSAKSFNTLN